MSKIVILDYGMGNLRSVQKALEKYGASVVLSSHPEEIKAMAALVVPGVGSFDDCIRNLKRNNLDRTITEFISSGRPFLGICLGLHILFEGSEEGREKGLGIFKGKVLRFSPILKVPHMGWNSLEFTASGKKCEILKDIKDGEYFYFVHSYYVKPEDKSIIATTTDYDVEFTSSVCSKNIFACQFHPEKSQKAGLKLIENFVKYTQKART
ncbi:MAG: imidazole glycerol phosphate synthase subunit HisH [Candidatus Aureabacteria bacterium]|nr:imidazole glycerol phosphate synthase subunit HisH [Candidatus Auribacterota bacterium]MCK5160874.1 imidazole glycerol phosphate synthase subunit HisH [Candidatus Auribacterota bacterium]MCK5654720.1 imidazole glycerol phosphate synthase subunit HisH [Candidatus Auribacterota bacterium]